MTGPKLAIFRLEKCKQKSWYMLPSSGNFKIGS